jgi:hypothetical protein
MTCTLCERAKANPRRDGGTPGCDGCKGRALAALGGHAAEALADEFTPAYRNTLERLFGDRWKQGHAKVKDWTQRISAATAQAKAAKVTT